MADIAFLLLVFFLVTTTIDTDKGLGIVLPPAGDVEIEIQKKNILNCLINSQGKVLLDEEPPAVVAGGISQALLTTAFGLIVAMIMQVSQNFFVSMIDKLILDMEEQSIKIVEYLQDSK